MMGRLRSRPEGPQYESLASEGEERHAITMGEVYRTDIRVVTVDVLCRADSARLQSPALTPPCRRAGLTYGGPSALARFQIELGQE